MRTIRKADIIDIVAERVSGLNKSQAEYIVNLIINSMKSALRRGGRIEIRGFGVFECKKRKPKLGRIIKTGEFVRVPEKYGIHFKPGKEFVELLNK